MVVYEISKITDKIRVTPVFQLLEENRSVAFLLKSSLTLENSGKCDIKILRTKQGCNEFHQLN